ncbi:MAG: cbb3-type cytochrome c oxidase subunit I [Alphaproteobacteria bacterium]|nr:cbb3-type cytochrome c oxidase subunit I [Alphaproteobacteria bacterium]
MQNTPYHWPKRWLMLGVTALAIAGLFSLVLVIARTPQLAAFKDLFSVALVVHVDLSVLVWFLAVMCVGMAMFIQTYQREPLPVIAPASWWCMAIGTFCMTISPLTGEWEVIKSNYIPVLFNGFFFLGLALIAAAILLVSVHLIIVALGREFASHTKHGNTAVDMGWVTIAIILLVALCMFYLSGEAMPAGQTHQHFFELLFWAGGHTLQFAYTMVMMLAWLALAKKVIARPVAPAWVLMVLWLLSLGAAMVPLYAFTQYTIDDQAFINHFTDIMIEWGGVAPSILFVALLWGLVRHWGATREYRACASALITSMALFAAGGLLGLMIQGQNVTIPAHYHGAIVGVTLALMGYAYALLPRFGCRAVTSWRSAFWQPILYGVGQVMHIGGLAYSGGYGVLRKTAAAGQTYAPEVKIALGVMGLGGLLAIIGGLMFVVVVWRSTRAQG